MSSPRAREKKKNKKSISGFKSTDYATSCPKIKIRFGFKSTNSMLAVVNYGCMFPGSPCHTQTETNANTPCSLIILYISVSLFTKNHTGMYKEMQK